MAEKLQAVSTIQCAGLEKSDTGFKQIEYTTVVSNHPVIIQHMVSGATRALCSFIDEQGDCKLIHKATKAGKNMKRIEDPSVKVPCPFVAKPLS
ncbi:MAG: hypothetical protein AAB373_05765 [Patescibacteria group bacterium]